jgi:hypothetical protein
MRPDFVHRQLALRSVQSCAQIGLLIQRRPGLASPIPVQDHNAATIALFGLASGMARPFAQAVYGSLVAVGASMAPVLVGPLGGLGFGAMCAVIAVLLGLGSVLMFWYPRVSDGGTQTWIRERVDSAETDSSVH